jgi:pimeloyl-ACP methyl ester carboxylesterase
VRPAGRRPVPEVEANGLRVHYQRVGQGEATVVMIHGLVIDNLSSLYYALAPGVAGRMQVLLYDLRGHGGTERPESGYGLEQAVDDLWALLDELGVDEPVYLLGNSYGGTIALEAARRAPRRVRGLVLIEAHIAVPGWGRHIAGQLELAGYGLNDVDLEAWLAGRPARKIASLVRTVDALVNTTSIVSDFASGPEMTARELREVTCPVYAVYGQYSDVFDRAEQLAANLPRCELDVLSDCSHSVMMEATRTIRGLVADWLTRALDDADVPGRRRSIAPGSGEGDGAENKRHVDSFIDAMNAKRAEVLARESAAVVPVGAGEDR